MTPDSTRGNAVRLQFRANNNTELLERIAEYLQHQASGKRRDAALRNGKIYIAAQTAIADQLEFNARQILAAEIISSSPLVTLPQFVICRDCTSPMFCGANWECAKWMP